MSTVVRNFRLFLFVFLVSTSFVSQAQTPTYMVGPTSINGFLYPWGINTAGQLGEQVQFLYLPSDFNTAPPRGFITSIWFRPYAGSASYNGSFTMNNLTVKMGHTTLGTMVAGSWQTGLTQVYGPTPYFINWTQGVWFEIVLATPFYYDGSSNLMIELFCNSRTVTASKYAEFDNASNARIAYGTTTSPSGTYNYRYNFGLEVFPGYPCTDTPKTSLKGPKVVCPNKPFLIAPDSFFADATYKWEYSNNGVTWSNFTGVPSQYQEITDVLVNQPRWYRCTITCIANNNFVWTTPPRRVDIAPFYYCYCDNSVVDDGGPDIGNLTIINTKSIDSVYRKSLLATGTGTPIFNNPQASRTYTSYHDSLAWPCFYRDTTYLFSVSQIQSNGSLDNTVVQGYVDYNRDGLYNPNTERVFVKAIDGTGVTPERVQVNAKIPSNAEIGPTGMRIIISKDTVTGAPCDTISGYGEVEDYIVEICHRPCDSVVNGGIVVSTDTSMCDGYEYTLTDTTYEKERSAFTRSWQVSGDNQSWFQINGSTNKDTLERIFTGQPLYYRVRTICLPTHDTGYSDPTEIKVKPGYKCYCYSKAIGGLAQDSSDIGGVSVGPYTSNSGGPHLLNAKAHLPRTDYTDAPPIELYTDSAYRFSVYHTMPVVEHGDAKVTIFMDFNNDHKYDIPSERIYTGYTTIGNHTLVDNVVIPLNAILDVPTGMRVILNNNVGPNIPSDEACGPYVSGETEDFILIFRDKAKLGIAGVSGLNGFNVHPNPTSGVFHVQFNTNAEISEVNVRVTNLTGQLIQQHSYNHNGGTFDKQLDMSNQAAGVYFIELEADGHKLMKKLVVQ